ncbi:MAG: cytochrome d terminal oxidase subunit 1 [Pseudomonadales bacterium]|jgi:cytochrome bd ubiquinol oxidase subunit I|uniref:cytochrome ubiquinol oxidase subunit I n=1 Tax=unclassified Ketobacter TaxID=2639109 RepID=UPI000C559A45|nr:MULTISPECIES: cytochrome ubiquinol oxidase subunit I [unclassified Ketobacter]MAQ25264.1 cytochrome d terminal oxidase subunit 1 [Pseudomonadales bacterium]MEC8811295.1 cytochrome ubiquinol oxidase subunit I [Pseudomonadota bacterium]TNC89516.1 MAG: cytochrome d terminal oxidase subunit 1 [Alcanivorax sp.]HAG94837.1 cytochrome bd-I ubiquinol oxidase subunit CydA [Gammaproteobacteria bacterium]MAQ27699.1 cytochrome d terminal oxidase subunit 1 [Pseudomonadales bacterium]|tara:strand:- start:7250 stop:8818 length:1569 start_codon:yes stop_codon:yes gene_type:complete
MIDASAVEVARLQFALTALFHFIFVPLTLGLSFILAIMESVYVLTQKQVYRDMTRFWGKLFGINFALGVTTGLTMEFQFGTNWAYYSHYVGDIFGVPLAIEGLMAFFLESTLIGLFFFGWERLSQRQHLAVTWLVALGSNLSALWILIANGWMQNPVGAEFNYETMRMELTSLGAVFFNPVAQVKFVHTVASGYVTGAMFVLGISSWYLLKGRDIPFARRSFAIAASFGTASILSVIVLGDESGYELGDVQQVKLAAIEAEWKTHEPPAAFTLIGWPDDEAQYTHYAVRIPYALGLVATRSVDKPVLGIDDLKARNEQRIRNGMVAYGLLQELRAEREAGGVSDATRSAFEAVKADLGYGLLLKQDVPDVVSADAAAIQAAVDRSIPKVWPLFFGFRIMVAAGFFMLVVFLLAFYESTRHHIGEKKWVLRMAFYSIPLPWIAAECGWIVAEYGRQPWSIGEILPTHLSASNLAAADVWSSLIAIVVFYIGLFIVEMFLMLHFVRKGPSSLGTGRYHFEGEAQ